MLSLAQILPLLRLVVVEGLAREGNIKIRVFLLVCMDIAWSLHLEPI